jgi:hypothetical protein
MGQHSIRIAGLRLAAAITLVAAVIESQIWCLSASDVSSTAKRLCGNLAAPRTAPERLVKARPDSRLVRVKALPIEEDETLLSWKVRSACPLCELPAVRSIDRDSGERLLNFVYSIYPLRC